MNKPKIGFLGAGDMASALASRWTAGGYDVMVAGRDSRKAERVAEASGARVGTFAQVAEHADVAVLAVRWEGVSWTLEQVGERLAGRVLVDVTNPVEVEDFLLVTPAGTSIAEQIQRDSGARVVKAFNLAHASVWTAAREVEGQPLAVPMATDHADARAAAAGLVAALGYTTVDAGDLRHARYLEAMAAIVVRRLFSGDEPSSTFAWVA